VIAGSLLAAATAAMALQSRDFAAGGRIPATLMAAACGGVNRPPALVWKNVPASAKSFALVLRDPDAPIPGGFYHWVVYDVAAAVRSLGGGAPLGAAHLGRSSTGAPAYYGPCPPPGPAHHYIFTLYALDVAHAGAGAAMTGRQLESAIRGHVVARASLEATAASP
jgi:hypothetical protein